MKQKNSVRKKIKLLSWTSFLALVTLLSIFTYNSYTYLENLKNVKIIIEMVDKNTSSQLKNEILKTFTHHIDSSQIIIYLLIFLGILSISLVVYLGRSIKKDVSKRIHAMDWIIE